MPRGKVESDYCVSILCCFEDVCSKPESLEHNHFVPISFKTLPAKKIKLNPPKTIQTRRSFWGLMAGKLISERVILPNTKTISLHYRISSSTITSSSKK